MDHALRVLEYEKLRQQLAAHAASSLGKERALNMQPDYTYDRVLANLNVTREATEVVRLRDRLPLGGLTDVRSEVKRAAIGSVLSTSELLAVAAVMYSGRQVKNFFEKLHEDNEDLRIPRLDEYAERLTKLIEVEQSIRHAIDDQGTVQDSASDRLRGLRTQLRSFEGSVRSRIRQHPPQQREDAVGRHRHDSERPLRRPGQDGVPPSVRRDRPRPIGIGPNALHRAAGNRIESITRFKKSA